MIDELVLLKTLNEELEKAKQDYHDNDEDVFSGAICSALETVIKAVREIPKLGANEIKQEINKKTDGYFPPMKERILHYFRDIDDKYIGGYKHLSTGLDALERELKQNIIKQLDEERELSYADFDKYINDYTLAFDREYDDFFSKGLLRAIDIVKEV
jgi:hypothetical protein